MTVLLFFASFIGYLSGCSGTVPSYRDSGDLIASIHTLGIAHPPGYALYILLGKLFVTLLPFGNVAYRVNVMSAFFAAAAVVALDQVLRQIVPKKEERWCSFLIAILFAASPAVVSLARVAEMYTLAAFLAAAIVLALFSDHPQGPPAAALFLGLGLSVHPTLIFLAPLFLISPSRMLTRRSALGFCLGLLAFLYLPIRAAQHPLMNWGDPSHWRNFWRVVTRADYGGLKLHPEESVFSWTPQSLWSQLAYFFKSLKGEWGWVATGFGVFGMFAGFKEPLTRRRTAALFAAWLLSGPGFFVLSNLPLNEATTPAILQPYLLLAGVLWAPLAATGIAWIASGTFWKRVSLGAILLGFFAVRPFSPSQRDDFYAYDYARNLLRSLPHGAVLYDPDDTTQFTLQVLQVLENRRPDVILLNFFRTRWGYEQIKRRWPDLLPPVPIDNGQDLQRYLWSYSARRQPFFAELPQKLGPMPYHSRGIVYAALDNSSAVSRAVAESLLQLAVQRGDFVTTHHSDFFTAHILSYYAAAQNNLGIEYAGIGDWRLALFHYQEALKIEPGQAAAQSNAAIALQKMPKLL